MEKQVFFESRVDIMRMPSWPTPTPSDHDFEDGRVSSSRDLRWAQTSFELPQFSSTGYSKSGLQPSSTHRGATNYNYGYSPAEPPNKPGLLIFSNDGDFSDDYSRCAWVHDHHQRWAMACWTCIALLSLIILAVIAIVLTWLIIIPRRPDLKLLDQAIRVQSFTVTKDFHYTSNPQGNTTGEVIARIIASFTLQVLVKNPNRVATDYSSSRFSMAYKDTVLGEATMPAFSQKGHATTQQPLHLVIAKVDVPQPNAFSLLDDANVHDNILLQVDGHVHTCLQILGLSTPPVLRTVFHEQSRFGAALKSRCRNFKSRTRRAIHEYRMSPDPSGIFKAWKANATGRNPTLREFLEKNYTETSGKESVKLAVRALLEVVESGGKTIEIAVMTRKEGLRLLEESEVEEIVAGIEAEKAAAEAAIKGPPRD